MRIAIATDMYLPQLGGVADTVVLQARGLRALGHEVRIFAAHMSGETPDTEVTRFASFELYGGTFCIVSPFGIKRALADFKPEVIHVHSFGTIGMIARFAARKLGIASVGTIHQSPVDYLHYFYLNFEPFKFLSMKFSAWFFGGFNTVTAPASQPLDLHIQYGLRHVQTSVISNAVDAGIFKHLDDRQTLKQRMGLTHRTVLLFGRLALEKNVDEAFHVFAEVHARTGAQLLVVGDGPYRGNLEEDARRLGIAEHVIFTGRLTGDPLVAAINACDVMLTTSRTEVQPMTILQANLCGVPVVGARAGGVPESVDDEKTGFVCDPGDVGAFSDRVSRLISDTELNKRMSDAAIVHANGKSPVEIARQWERLYRTLPGAL